MHSSKRTRRELLTGLGFLAPNILGFLAFTLIPLVFSLVLAFSNWDLKLHNPFQHDQPLKMVGFDNFQRLLNSPDFWKFLGNTLFFMMGLPFGIAASLIAALMLSKDLKGGNRRVQFGLAAGALLVTCVLMLVAVGAGGTGMVILILAVAGGITVLGTGGGSTVYRTLFYVPNFTSGVATYLLWKKLYNPHTGPVNQALNGPLIVLGNVVNKAPSLFSNFGMWLLVSVALIVLIVGLLRIWRDLSDGDVGPAAAFLPLCALLTPSICLGMRWGWLGLFWAIFGGIVLCSVMIGSSRLPARDVTTRPPGIWEGMGNTFMFALALMVGQFVLFGLAAVMRNLPAMAKAGLAPPDWLNEYEWAKPAIMLMGFWGAIGSNTMLLYLAALTNVPVELYEAADIDGASRFAKFWNVTWPQLAPTTFFVVVMGVIGGLQGGFETAKVMTNGGPAGSTTTLSYFIYTEGFTTGRLGYSSAVAWTMFLLVLLLTLVNWKFGTKYVND